MSGELRWLAKLEERADPEWRVGGGEPRSAEAPDLDAALRLILERGGGG